MKTLLLISKMKSGTTSLYWYFCQHPQFIEGDVKEPFDNIVKKYLSGNDITKYNPDYNKITYRFFKSRNI